MLCGINKIVNVVSTTFGPKGRNVMFLDRDGNPFVTNDGLSAAKEIPFDTVYEKMSGDTIIDIAKKVKIEAGDSSTTAIIISSEIAKRGFYEINKGANSMEIKRGILSASREIVLRLKENSHKINTQKEALNIAIISSESKELGEIVSSVVWKVGKNGTVAIEDSNSFETDYTIGKGLQFEGGYISPNMVTNEGLLESEMETPFIVVIDKKITNNDNIQNVLQRIISAGKRECVIIANDFDDEVMTLFSVNRMRGSFKVLAIKSAGFANRKFDVLNDICLITGATLIGDSLGIGINDINEKHFGKAKKVVSSQTETTIIDAFGDSIKIQERIEQLNSLMRNTNDVYDKDKIKERIAKISGGVGIIRVGAKTEIELHYKKLKIKDAVRAVQSAIQEGHIAGGGGVLYHIAMDLMKTTLFPSDFEKGFNTMIIAIMSPINQLLINGKRSKFNRLKLIGKNLEYGYDAKRDKFNVNLIKEGIIDPVKATRSVVEHSASGISTLLTVGTLLDNGK